MQILTIQRLLTTTAWFYPHISVFLIDKKHYPPFFYPVSLMTVYRTLGGGVGGGEGGGGGGRATNYFNNV